MLPATGQIGDRLGTRRIDSQSRSERMARRFLAREQDGAYSLKWIPRGAARYTVNGVHHYLAGDKLLLLDARPNRTRPSTEAAGGAARWLSSRTWCLPHHRISSHPCGLCGRTSCARIWPLQRSKREYWGCSQARSHSAPNIVVWRSASPRDGLRRDGAFCPGYSGRAIIANASRRPVSVIMEKIYLIAQLIPCKAAKNSLLGCVGNWSVRH